MTKIDPSKIDEATSAGRVHRRTVPGAVVIVIVVLLLVLFASRMVPHPIGPARTYGKYEGKAATTAESALSSTETVRLVAHAASRGDAFGPYTAMVVTDAEEGVSGMQGTFASIQPPDGRAEDLASDLDEILGATLEHVRDVRVAARRGELGDLERVAAPLEEDARKLQQFVEHHK
jgi:hypothetical protein